MKSVTLQKGKEKSLLRFHPWVFSGAVLRHDDTLLDGDIVEVFDFSGNYLATGHYNNSSICVRIFSFDRIEPSYDFWKDKVIRAINFRKALFLFNNPDINMFRLINGEGDGLPGLIVDWFDGNVVFQFHSYGMYLLQDTFMQILLELFPWQIKSVFNKSASTLGEIKENVAIDHLLYGAIDDVLVKENGIPFYIDILRGQKTGFFIDQRDNRKLVREFAAGKKVLNLFSYTGGFSSYALAGNAELVHSVDISKKAIEYADRNIALLDMDTTIHQSFAENVFDFLDEMPADFYDLIVVDPPAFAKHHKVKEQGVKGYRNINRKAMEKIKSGGFIFTFSCSQAISQDDFQTIIFSAAAMENKNVRIVKHLQHALDHPVSIFHPEGSYLKGLLLYIS
jgi:23S rRNA (cytosine1962-C5)-methyltransferase